MQKIIILFTVLLGCFSCSSYKVTKVTQENRHTVKGLRFFMPAPYLLVAEKDLLVDGLTTVKEGEKGKVSTTEKMAVARKELQCSVIYLPDPQQEYAIRTSVNANTSIKLKDGWRLSGINSLESPDIGEKELKLLSGTQDLTPGVYAIILKDSPPTLKKVEILR